MSYRKSFEGFTLIELLVVISIIALLIAILLPALSRARDAGAGVQCLSNQRQIMISMTTYRDDFGGYPQLPNVASDAANRWGWAAGLFSYLGGKTPDPGQNWLPYEEHFPTVGACPKGDQDGSFEFWNYGANYPVTVPYAINPAFPARPSRPMDEDFIKRTVMIADAESFFLYSPAFWPPLIDTDGDGIPDTNTLLAGSPATEQAGLRFRHGGESVAHFAYNDGSAEAGDRAYAFENNQDIWGKYLLP